MRLSVEAKGRYIAICRRLDHDEKVEEEGQDTLDQHPGKQTKPSKPLPDYSQLQHEAKKQQLKVGRGMMSIDTNILPMEDVALSKNGKTRTIMGFRAISKNRNGIGICRKIFKEKKAIRCKSVY